MMRLWKIAVYEYRQNVFKKSFIFILLSVPIMIAFGIGLGFFMESLQNNSLPVGVVDLAGILDESLLESGGRSSGIADDKGKVDLITFQTKTDARTALEARQIQVYYLLPPDYLTTRRIEAMSISKPGENAWRQFFGYLQTSLLVDQPEEITVRLVGGSAVIVRSLDGSREVPGGGPTFSLFLPLFITIAFLVMLMMSSGYMMGAVAEEKENRTMEVLVTSVSPIQLIGGKIVGIFGISMTILLSWTIFVVLGIFIAAQMGVTWFGDVSVDWRVVLSSITIALPAYVLAVALMTAIGSMVTSTQEGQSVSAIFYILHMVPFYVSVGYLNDPNGALAVTMSLLPFTALVTVGMRNLFTIVPAWQVMVSIAVQIISALCAIWLASRAFRSGMLRYGQRLYWHRLIRSKP